MTAPGIYRRLLAYLRPYVWPRFALGVACMLVYSAMNGAVPFLVRDVFDYVFTRHDRWMLYVLPALVLLVFLLRGLTAYGNSYLMEWVGQRVITDLRDELNERVQHLPLSFFNRTPTGTIVSRMTNDVAQLREALTQSSISLVRDTSSLVVVVVAAFWLDWMLALIGFVAFPLAVSPVLRLSQRLRRYSKRGQETLGTLTALLQETVQGNRIVKAFGMEEYEQRRFGEENHRLFGLYMKATRARASIQPIMEMLGALGVAGVLWYGGYSVINGIRTQGDFLGFLAALVLVYDPFKGVARANGQIQQGLASAERIFELLDQPTDVVERAQPIELPPFRDAIRFEDVTFRYPPRAGEPDTAEPALSDVNVVLRRGEVVALVGSSGGGKSTLGDLIPRFYDPTAGRITFDGVDLRDASLRSLRGQIGIVTQFTFLFNDTIRANVAYGSAEPTPGAVEEACRAAHAHEFIAALPQGYDTVVGELGVTLSGGQRQRLAIARALLKNAPILILDEATSALDSESERLVQDAIDRLMEGRTTLVIAHRLATVQRADRIAVLAGGRVVELGTHQELLAQGQIYHRLHEQQSLGRDLGAREPAAPWSS
jgi:ATP-binding cassette, subfamily B, bacterial MsbA